MDKFNTLVSQYPDVLREAQEFREKLKEPHNRDMFDKIFLYGLSMGVVIGFSEGSGFEVPPPILGSDPRKLCYQDCNFFNQRIKDPSNQCRVGWVPESSVSCTMRSNNARPRGV